MPFEKRPLSDEEWSLVDWETLGIAAKRVPPKHWSWSVHPERRVLCAQLLSDTGEMREGWYWYLLLIEGKPIVYEVDAFSLHAIDGRSFVKTSFTLSSFGALDAAAVEDVAIEAHAVLSQNGETLLFQKGAKLGKSGA